MRKFTTMLRNMDHKEVTISWLINTEQYSQWSTANHHDLMTVLYDYKGHIDLHIIIIHCRKYSISLKWMHKEGSGHSSGTCLLTMVSWIKSSKLYWWPMVPDGSPKKKQWGWQITLKSSDQFHCWRDWASAFIKVTALISHSVAASGGLILYPPKLAMAQSLFVVMKYF